MAETKATAVRQVHDAAVRVIRSAHRRDGETLPPGEGMIAHGPRRPESDDDTALLDYLRRMEAADERAGRYTGVFIGRRRMSGLPGNT